MNQHISRDGEFNVASIGQFRGAPVQQGYINATTTFGGLVSNVASCTYNYTAIGNLVMINGLAILTTAGAGFFTFSLPPNLPAPLASQEVGMGAGTAPIGPGFLSLDPSRPGVITCSIITTATPGFGQMIFSANYIADIRP